VTLRFNLDDKGYQGRFIMPQIAVTEGVLPHLFYTPGNVASDALPLIVFLHGVGERGTDPNLVRKWSLPKFLDMGNELPVIALSPQCPMDTRWDFIADSVLELVDNIVAAHPVNPQRIYLTGFSMGGRGTWAIAVQTPDKFAAYAPVAGRIPEMDGFLDKVCVLKDKPIWVFHGVKDEAVEVANSDTLVQTLRDCGASNLKYTRYDDAGHGEASDWTYSNMEFYDWLLQHESTP
jgi:predicted peptidase